MEILLIALLGGAAGAAIAAWLIHSRHQPEVATGAEAPELIALREEVRRIGQQVSTDTTRVEHRLDGIDTRMSNSQSDSTRLARDIFETLGDVRQATTTVAEQAREFSSLQDLLKPPKARGGVGEAMLEELLRQVLPPASFATQHRFSTGATVDAIVRAGGKIVCIDSKFPLANYRRMCEAGSDVDRAEAERAFAADVHKHMKDISTRYIIPDENTFDFAVMYVPAEGVYAEVLRMSHRKRPLFETALEARVVPMSPLTMYGYLQTVMFGLKCLKIEESAEAILNFCGRLQTDMERFASGYDTLGQHLLHARAKFDEGAGRLERFRGKLDRVIDLADDPDHTGDTPPPLELVAE